MVCRRTWDIATKAQETKLNINKQYSTKLGSFCVMWEEGSALKKLHVENTYKQYI